MPSDGRFGAGGRLDRTGARRRLHCVGRAFRGQDRRAEAFHRDETVIHIVVKDENKDFRSADLPDETDLILLGSDPGCHVYLPDYRVAERHLSLTRVSRDELRLAVCTMPEGAPTANTRVYVNARELADDQRIRHNDEILIARFRVHVYLDSATAHAPKASAMEDAAKIRAHPLHAGAIVLADSPDQVHLRGDAPALLARFANVIHGCFDLASLMSTTLREVMAAFSAHQVWIGARRRGYGRFEYVETRRADHASVDPPIFETYKFRSAERGQYICVSDCGRSDIESALSIPLVTDRGILGMLYVDNKSGAAPYGPLELDLLGVMGALVANQLERVVLDLVKLQEAVVAGELSFMRELQARMDPTNVPQWEGLQLAVYCKPGMDSAGDVYDVMRLPNGLAAFICGHMQGAPTRAALAMAEVRSAFRMGGLHADPPHVLLRAANWMIHDERSPCRFVAVAIVMNAKTGAMQYATAGDIGAVVVDARGALRSLTQADVPPVGSHREFAYTPAAGRLEEGETMVLYTPGCLATTDTQGRPLGVDRFHDAVSDGFGQTASAALDELLSEHKAFFKQGRHPDDICIMMIHRD